MTDPKQPLTVKISPQDIGDFYYMVRKHSRETCNTFHYLWRSLAQLYPHIAQHYGDTFED